MTDWDQSSVQALLDAAECGDYAPVFETFAENIIVENGPGAGPWRRAESRDEFANELLEFSSYFNGTFRQHGRSLYADDRVVINLTDESGSTPAGDTFDNLAVYVSRVGTDGKVDRLWTVELDTEAACPEFWGRNRVESASDSRGEQNEGPSRNIEILR